MRLLRLAVTETTRALGFNVPTVITGLLGIGLSILVVPRFSAPETDSGARFLLWLLESIALLAALAGVFVPLLVCKLFTTARQLRSVRARIRLDDSIAASGDDQMKTFLRKLLTNAWYGVAKCYVFGSVVGQHPTRDVDVVIQFDCSTRRQVRTYRERLRDIESQFQDVYSRQLHLQTFLSAEDEALQSFLNRAGRHERLN